jgi:hypothetical protein
LRTDDPEWVGHFGSVGSGGRGITNDGSQRFGQG